MRDESEAVQPTSFGDLVGDLRKQGAENYLLAVQANAEKDPVRRVQIWFWKARRKI